MIRPIRSSSGETWSGAVQLTPTAITDGIAAATLTTSSIGSPPHVVAPSRHVKLTHAGTGANPSSARPIARASLVDEIVSIASRSGSVPTMTRSRALWKSASVPSSTAGARYSEPS